MPTQESSVRIDVHFDPDASLATMEREVRRGLRSRPKEIPSKYFYDERGSLLFEEITRLPEYYPTRAELSLLEDRSEDISRITRPREVVELGSGSARKSRTLLRAARTEGHLERYVPVDVSREIAESSARELVQEFPGLAVHAVVGDFEHHLDEIPEGEHRLIAFLGSTIGNFPADEAREFLSAVRSILGETDRFLLGTDLVKDTAVLEAAYNDSAGVTAEFNRNMLQVLNDRLDGDFRPERFEHVAFYDEDLQRIEMHLRSVEAQVVRLDRLGLEAAFEADERLRTEVSCKYTRESVEAMVRDAGMSLEHWFTGDDEAFALSLCRGV